jgi:hypothetical protein
MMEASVRPSGVILSEAKDRPTLASEARGSLVPPTRSLAALGMTGRVPLWLVQMVPLTAPSFAAAPVEAADALR